MGQRGRVVCIYIGMLLLAIVVLQLLFRPSALAPTAAPARETVPTAAPARDAAAFAQAGRKCNVRRQINPYNVTSGCGSFHRGLFFGLHVCVHDPALDGHMSAPIASSRVPHMESAGFELAGAYLKLHPHGTVIDVGANVGLFSLLALLTGHPVLAIDPVPAHAEMLLRTAALNEKQDQLIVFQNAISDYCFSNGILTPFNPSNPGSTALVASGPAPAGVNGGDGGDVSVVTIDAILMMEIPSFNDTGIPFLKVDIEGSEPDMFATAALLWKNPPHLIFMEVFVSRLERGDMDAATFLDYLFNKGYDLQIFPRLNLNYNHRDIIRTKQAFDAFVLNHLRSNVEMDVMLHYTGRLGRHH